LAGLLTSPLCPEQFFTMQIVFIGFLALFFGAAIANLMPLVAPDNVLAMLAVTSIALFLTGLIARRMGRGPSTAPAATPVQERAATATHGGSTSQNVAQAERKRGAQETDASRANRQAEDSRPARQATPNPDAANEEGTVKWFNRTKGFGFIVRASGDEIFVHQRSIVRTGRGDDRQRPMLRDGQKVRFSVANHDKGLQAEDVVALD
jgi:cold shock CspA family protein